MGRGPKRGGGRFNKVRSPAEIAQHAAHTVAPLPPPNAVKGPRSWTWSWPWSRTRAGTWAWVCSGPRTPHVSPKPCACRIWPGQAAGKESAQARRGHLAAAGSGGTRGGGAEAEHCRVRPRGWRPPQQCALCSCRQRSCGWTGSSGGCRPPSGTRHLRRGGNRRTPHTALPISRVGSAVRLGRDGGGGRRRRHGLVVCALD